MLRSSTPKPPPQSVDYTPTTPARATSSGINTPGLGNNNNTPQIVGDGAGSARRRQQQGLMSPDSNSHYHTSRLVPSASSHATINNTPPNSTYYYIATSYKSAKRTAAKASIISLSWVCYGCASLWLGLVLMLVLATASLVMSVLEEAGEDYTQVDCGVEDGIYKESITSSSTSSISSKSKGGNDKGAAPASALSVQRPAVVVALETQTLATIGFASCNKHDEPQTFWPLVSDVLRHESELAERHNPSVVIGTKQLRRKKKSKQEEVKKDEFAQNQLGNTDRRNSNRKEGSGESDANNIPNIAITANPHKDDARAVGTIKPQYCPRKAIPSHRSTSTSSASSSAAPADAFIWLGDAVYLDGNAVRGVDITVATEIAYSAMDVPIPGYESSNKNGTVKNPFYRAFKAEMALNLSTAAAEKKKDKTNIGGRLTLVGEEPSRPSNTIPSRIIGTWDDHDMGINDGGKEFKHHTHTQGRFMDFLEVGKGDMLRQRKGVYSFHALKASDEVIKFGSSSGDGKDSHNEDSTASTYSSTSTSSYKLSDHYDNAFCIILLDARTHRDPIALMRGGDMLGDEQWAWFEEVLANNVSDAVVGEKKGGVPTNNDNDKQKSSRKQKCAATIIGSGIQFLSSEKPTEQWWNFKHNRAKLWQLLRKYRIERTALISGDIHLMEIVKADGDFTGLGYPIIDFTSSGLTHHSGLFFDMFTYFRHALAKVFPMAVSCTSRGMTPVVSADILSSSAAGADGDDGDDHSHNQQHLHRQCRSAFSLLPDWVYETLFPSMEWRLGHYLGKNVGAISLQVSAPIVVGGGGKNATIIKSIDTHPKLSLRFAGYALDLTERNDKYIPFRYENEKRGGGDDNPNDDFFGEKSASAANNDGSSSTSATPHPHYHPAEAHSVTRHDATHLVMEYVQPLEELTIPPLSNKNNNNHHHGDNGDAAMSTSSSSASHFVADHTIPIDGSNTPFLKYVLYICQAQLAGVRRGRNLGVVVGLGIVFTPIGVVAIAIASFIVRHCKGTEKRKKARKVVRSKAKQ